MEGTAVVTGATSGIGAAIARHLLVSRCTVVALQRRPPRLQHQRLLYHAVDLASPESGCITGQTLFVCGGTSVSGTGGE